VSGRLYSSISYCLQNSPYHLLKVAVVGLRVPCKATSTFRRLQLIATSRNNHGGLFGIGSVSAGERQALEQIAAQLKDR